MILKKISPEMNEITEEEIQIGDIMEGIIHILARNTWFNYKRAFEIFIEFDKAYLQSHLYFNNPARFTDIRPISLFLMGEVNTGKTTLVARYQSYREEIDKRKGRKFSRYDIVAIDAPIDITFREMFVTLLEEFDIDLHFKVKIHTNRLIEMLIKELKKRKVKLLFIDDIQNLVSTSKEDLDEIFNGFRKIMNRSQTRFVLVGLPSASVLFEGSNWVDERFRVLHLPRWDPYSQEYIDLLFTIHSLYQEYLPDWDLVSTEGNLNKDIALFLHELTGSKLGKLIQTIKQAVIHALVNQRTNILKDDYKHVQTMHYRMQDGCLVCEDILID